MPEEQRPLESAPQRRIDIKPARKKDRQRIKSLRYHVAEIKEPHEDHEYAEVECRSRSFADTKEKNPDEETK